MRLLNVGTEEFSYGITETQRWARGGWVRMREGFIEAPLYFQHSGTVSECIGRATGRHWLPGRYRLVLKLNAFDGSGSMPLHVLRPVFRLRSG